MKAFDTKDTKGVFKKRVKKATIWSKVSVNRVKNAKIEDQKSESSEEEKHVDLSLLDQEMQLRAANLKIETRL